MLCEALALEFILALVNFYLNLSFIKKKGGSPRVEAKTKNLTANLTFSYIFIITLQVRREFILQVSFIVQKVIFYQLVLLFAIYERRR